jgi:hypothetical protein
LIRLGEFDRLIEQRRRERVESRKRNRAVAAARSSRTADAIGPAPRAADGGVQVGRYLANIRRVRIRVRNTSILLVCLRRLSSM